MSEGKEPPCFLQLFQGGLVVHKGSREDGRDSAGERRRAAGNSEQKTPDSTSSFFTSPLPLPYSGDWRLFCVRGEAEAEASLVEVDCQHASLRSRSSLVLVGVPKRLVYLWHGCKAHVSARSVARRAADRLIER